MLVLFAIVLVAALADKASAFAPPLNSVAARPFITSVTRDRFEATKSFGRHQIQHNEQYQPPALRRQRKSMAQVSTMSLFGLGAPEIAIILVAAAFLLGPQKLSELGKDAGKIAGELKDVPKEFQKGIAEGEAEAKKLKIKSSIVEEAKKEAKEAEKE